MTQIQTTRRRFPAALLLTAIVLSTTLLVTASQAGAHTATSIAPKKSSVSKKVCPYKWKRGAWHVKQLIRCAARYWNVSGGPQKALAIAHRESRFKPRAYNSSSGASGIFQHLQQYWPNSARTYGFPGWSAFNARANIIVSMRMVKAIGWGPWGG
jgi:soluble lytic murein transglycosylase-like protein